MSKTEGQFRKILGDVKKSGIPFTKSFELVGTTRVVTLIVKGSRMVFIATLKSPDPFTGMRQSLRMSATEFNVGEYNGSKALACLSREIQP